MIALRAALVMMHHHPLADPRRPRVDGSTERDHHAARLVAGDDGTVLRRYAGGLGLALGSAIVMQVAAAHAGSLHLDHDIMGVGSGIGELHQFQPAIAREYNAAHRFLPFCFGLEPILNGKSRLGKAPAAGAFSVRDQRHKIAYGVLIDRLMC
jgi:hypothetical protein